MINPARDVTAFVLSIDKRPESQTLQDCATATGISMTEQENNRNEEDYVGEIKGGLRPTMRLIVMGIVHKQPRSMEVLVSCQSKGEGDDEIEGDVGLELKVKFPEKTVLRNARLSGKWGTSESALSFFPFAPGEAFKMEIVCEHQQFRVLVDGQPLCGFAHRLTHLGSLNALRVHGDLQLTKVA